MGFLPDAKRWGTGEAQGGERLLCPAGFAVMGVPLRFQHRRSAELTRVSGTDCCPLPDGVLVDRHHFTLKRCEAGFVVTGHVEIPEGTKGLAGDYLRCTKLDDRYGLAEAAPGQRFGAIETGALANALGTRENALSRGQLPVGIRYGLGRVSKLQWEELGCVGRPPGALLVGKRGFGCDGLLFAELVERESGRPVTVVPQCAAIDDPFVEEPKCVGGVNNE